jgi:hypothetical protein
VTVAIRRAWWDYPQPEVQNGNSLVSELILQTYSQQRCAKILRGIPLYHLLFEATTFSPIYVC